MGAVSSAWDGAGRTVEAETADDTLEKFCIIDVDDETCRIEEKAGKTTIASLDLENKDNPEGILTTTVMGVARGKGSSDEPP